jgi:dolichol kinase
MATLLECFDWRRRIHVLVHGTLGVLILVLAASRAAVALSVLATLSLATEAYRLRAGSCLNEGLTRRLGAVVKPWERRRISAPTWSYIGLAVMLWTFVETSLPTNLVAFAAFVLAVGDPAAGIYRARFGGRRILGSVVFLITTLPLAYALSRGIPHAFSIDPGWRMPLLSALFAAAAEFFSLEHLDDNALIPPAALIPMILFGGYHHTQMFAVFEAFLLLAVGMGLINMGLTKWLKAPAGVPAR